MSLEENVPGEEVTGRRGSHGKVDGVQEHQPAKGLSLSSRGHLDGQPLESAKQGCPADQIAERPEQELGDS